MIVLIFCISLFIYTMYTYKEDSPSNTTEGWGIIIDMANIKYRYLQEK